MLCVFSQNPKQKVKKINRDLYQGIAIISLRRTAPIGILISLKKVDI